MARSCIASFQAIRRVASCPTGSRLHSRNANSTLLVSFARQNSAFCIPPHLCYLLLALCSYWLRMNMLSIFKSHHFLFVLNHQVPTQLFVSSFLSHRNLFLSIRMLYPIENCIPHRWSLLLLTKATIFASSGSVQTLMPQSETMIASRVIILERHTFSLLYGNLDKLGIRWRIKSHSVWFSLKISANCLESHPWHISYKLTRLPLQRLWLLQCW
jgi:hypothetical protein